MQILRAAIVGLAALIAALLLPSANASAVPADIRLVDGYTYDADCHAAHTANTGSESGPPLGAGRYASHIAVGHRSRGSSAHADAEPGYVDTTYDVSALPVPSDNATTTTAEPADLIDGTVSSLQGWRVAAKSGDEFVNLASEGRTTHILDGDITGGGHAWPGLPGKTPFPDSWSRDRIMHEISDVATDPSSIFRTGRGGSTIVTGTRDGVDIRVIIRNGDIVTGYPTNLPRN